MITIVSDRKFVHKKWELNPLTCSHQGPNLARMLAAAAMAPAIPVEKR